VGLKVYRRKRKFDVTPEPRGRQARSKGHQFVVQKHAARRLHYDFRLELDGVMKSWAVTRGPSLVPGEKRLAVQVEDHPIEYNKFEGTIPQGEYGGGIVMIWDCGRWLPEGDPHEGLEKGQLSFRLDGKKLKGGWHLIRMRGGRNHGKENWLLIKARDEAARSRKDPDILEEMPLSVATGHSIEEIGEGRGRNRIWHSNRSVKDNVLDARTISTPSKTRASKIAAKASKIMAKKSKRGAEAGRSDATSARDRPKPWNEGDVRFTHPDRVYWVDVGVTKQDLADYYRAVWDWMAPHLVDRPLAMVRCPEGTKGECFFQKHAHAGLSEQKLRTVTDSKGRQIIAIEDLSGLLALVQAGVLEVHVRGSTIDRLDRCDRIVFDLDPGEGVPWSGLVDAARDVRERLAAIDLESFVKLSGGKGLHVVVPIEGTDWDTTKTFVQAFAQAMAADDPQRYLAKMTKSLRRGKIFIDYLRNSLEQTSVAAYSTRARAGAPVSVPVGWQELGRTSGGNQYTVLNLMKRLGGLKQDPWREMGRRKQKLPDLQALGKRG
jgi:bifunctional non-homologous end joining protein LigD